MRWLIASTLLLAGCASMADSVARRSARSVVLPVASQYMPAGQAQLATDCVLNNANAGEISSLARDLGTRAGTTTVQTVATIALRPGTIQCLTSQGLPMLGGVSY